MFIQLTVRGRKAVSKLIASTALQLTRECSSPNSNATLSLLEGFHYTKRTPETEFVMLESP